MKTVLTLLDLSVEFLRKNGVLDPRQIAQDLLAHTLGWKRLDLYLNYERPLSEREIAPFREKIARAAKKEPVEYIIGEIEFCGLLLKVDKRALIPRKETEIFVEKIAKQIEKGVLFDVCTGSGCIGIALKKKRPDLEVFIGDLSSAALDLARENAEKNGVDVHLLQGDFLEPFRGKKADIVVCNPPYIRKSDYEKLDPSVRMFEPIEALIGGEKGTEYYERMQREIPGYLKENARLFFEIGYDQEEALLELFPEGKIERDFSSHPRFFTVCF